MKSSKPLKTDRLAILKNFLIIFLPLSALAVVGGKWLNQEEIKIQSMALESNEVRNVDLQAEVAASDFDLIESDVLFLAAHPELPAELENSHRPLNSETSEINSQVTRQFLSLAQYQKLYNQIRLLDTTGQEIVRVNFNNGQPQAIPKKNLQSKANRYWFKETLRLQREEIFVSPLDLNIENNQIEQPLKPVIRFGTPIFNRQGQKLGILVVNYLGKNFLANLQKEKTTALGTMMLVNAEGYWLKGLKPEDEWGFMYRNRRDRTYEAHPTWPWPRWGCLMLISNSSESTDHIDKPSFWARVQNVGWNSPHCHFCE